MGKKCHLPKKPLAFLLFFFFARPPLVFFSQRGVNLRLASSFGEAHREAIYFLNGIEGTFFSCFFATKDQESF